MRIFILLLLALAVIPLRAQEPSQDAQPANPAVDASRIENLISTLESDAERQQLIEQLQLMVEATQQEAGPLESITEALNIEQAGTGLASEVVHFLSSYGLSKSFIGDLVTFALMLLLITAGVFINGRLSLLFDRRLKKLRKRFHLDGRRFHSLFRLQRWAGYGLGLALLLYSVLHLFASYQGGKSQAPALSGLFSTGFVLVVVFLLVLLIWEGVNASLEVVEYKNRRLNPARLQTITPIIRNALLFALTLMALMVVLSELGVNIMPLLAGAGVLGIAIGFGAQTLVRDFLAGAMVIFEDLLQIGDVVQLGDKFGVVEKITIRKIQLRDLDGTVHTVPFGEVTIVSNLTKEYSYYLFNVGVAYRENVDEVIACLKELDAGLRADEKFGPLILEPIEILGLDKFDDSAIVIKARTKTLPHEKWTVGREFNRRMKIAFDERNIEIPFPHQTIYFGEDKQGQAPNANVRLVREKGGIRPEE